jgi:DNA-binding transcriptional LysR family regulator
VPENPDALRVAYARGVTPAKWERIWRERRPDLPIELQRIDAPEQRSVLTEGAVHLCFLRLPVDRDGLHLIPLYSEQPVVVVPKDHAASALDSVTMHDLDGEVVHPFDEHIEDTLALVAAGVGVVVLPQSIARLHARRDLLARPVLDAEQTDVALAWPIDPVDTGAAFDLEAAIDDFIGIVRGRTARSSRGERQAPDETAKPARNAATRSRQGGRSGAQGRTAARGAASTRGGRRRRSR